MKYFRNKTFWILLFGFGVLIAAVFVLKKQWHHHTTIGFDRVPIASSDDDIAKAKKSESTDEFKNYYGEPASAPPVDYAIDISNKTLPELRILENGIYARHNYLFEDAVMRGYFNQFQWYQPIFWDSAFKVSLNDSEKNFIEKISARESDLLRQNYKSIDGHKVANLDNVVNFIQFKYVSDTLKKHLASDGFAIVPAKNMQLFHVYDQNQYDAIPSFVTSDVYLQLMHIKYSNLIKYIEENYIIPELTQLLKSLYTESNEMCRNKDERVRDAATFNTTFYAIAYYLICREKLPVPAKMSGIYNDEISKASQHSGGGSELLNDPYYDYSQLKPRGFYTKNEKLRRYFGSMKWLLTAPFYLDEDKKFSASVLSAQIIANGSIGGKSLLNLFNSINDPISFIVGKPDNLFTNDMIQVLKEKNLLKASPIQVISKSNLAAIKDILLKRDPERIKRKGGTEKIQQKLAGTAMYFMPGRYNFDAEILQRLIEVTEPNPKRIFPKGLDVFAAMGDKEAENILLNRYHENKTWPGYSDTLHNLKRQFSGFNDWNLNAYNKSMQCLDILQKKDNTAPYYMQNQAWDKKTLNTSLGYWSELKHDVILYAKQPGAECGEGGGPEPPVYPGYVEPDINFWKNCIALLDVTSDGLAKYNMTGEDFKNSTREMKNMAQFFLDISLKEIHGEVLTKKDFDTILWIGGKIEGLTQSIIQSGVNESDSGSDVDNYAGCVADVYTYQTACLEEATGWANEIYVVAEINGYLYLTRGAVYSYYEFPQSSDDRLTDEEWHEKMEKGDIPSPPEWMNSITAPIKPLTTLPWYTYSANPSAMKDQ